MCWVRFTFPMSGFCYITLSFLITRLSCPVNLEMESLVFGLFCPRVVHFVQPEDPMFSFFFFFKGYTAHHAKTYHIFSL